MIIDIHDRATALLDRLAAGLKNRGVLHQMVGRRVQNHIRDYLIQLARTRHATADRLGAQYSGHLGKAAEKVALPKAVSEVPGGVAINLQHPGMGRAFHDVDIFPGPGKKFLTIPQIAQAYNQRARAVKGLVFAIIRDGKGGKRKVLGVPDEDGKLKIWYNLRSSVHQKQDKTLMPTRDTMTAAALAGARAYIALLRAVQKQGNSK
jgi:hypothetical protein